MSDKPPAVLTPEQWEARDYRQTARDIDQWAREQPGAGDDDATEYVAKMGLSERGSVIVMNRAHDRVLVPPPARPALAAFALLEEPFGFTHADVRVVLQAAERTDETEARAQLRDLARRLERLLPPAAT